MEKVVDYNLSMEKRYTKPELIVAGEDKLSNDKQGGDWPRPDQWEAAVQSPCLLKQNNVLHEINNAYHLYNLDTGVLQNCSS
jgi:hypothetical protein